MSVEVQQVLAIIIPIGILIFWLHKLSGEKSDKAHEQIGKRIDGLETSLNKRIDDLKSTVDMIYNNLLEKK